MSITLLDFVTRINLLTPVELFFKKFLILDSACFAVIFVRDKFITIFDDWCLALRILSEIVYFPLPLGLFISQYIFPTFISGVVEEPLSTNSILLLKYSAKVIATFCSSSVGIGFISIGGYQFVSHLTVENIKWWTTLLGMGLKSRIVLELILNF